MVVHSCTVVASQEVIRCNGSLQVVVTGWDVCAQIGVPDFSLMRFFFAQRGDFVATFPFSFQ